MAVTFQVRGTSLDAWYSTQGKEAGIGRLNSDADPAVTSYGDSSVFGGQAINLSTSGGSTNPRVLIYPGFRNFSQTGAFTIRMRIVPNWTGFPATTQTLLWIGPNRTLDIGGTYPQFGVLLSTNGKFQVIMFGPLGSGYAPLNALTVGTWSATSGVASEFQISWTGLGGGGANGIKFSRDGANAETLANPSAANAWPATAWKWMSQILVGFFSGQMGANCTNWALNELLIFDTAESQTYTARTAFDSTRANIDGMSNSDPGVTNVNVGTGYTIAGTALTGTKTTPAASDVKTGVTFGASLGSTGTYDGSDRWTDPGVANVRSSTAYKANSTSNNRTGTAAIPTAANVRSGTATDATTGTLAVPAASNVRSGTAVDNTTGTAAIPIAVNVRSGVATDNTTGTLVAAAAATTKHGVAADDGTGSYRGADLWSDPGIHNVATGVAYNADGVALTGDSDEPAESDVKHGVVYDNSTKTGTYRGADLYDDVAANQLIEGVTKNQNGVAIVGSVVSAAAATTKIGVTANDGVGTYVAAERWDELDPSLVSRNHEYLANGETLTGELDNVTNLLVAPDLEGQSNEATLEAT